MKKTFVILVSALFTSLLALAATATPVSNLTTQQIEINAQVNFGLSDFTNSLLLNYQEPNSTTASTSNSATVTVTANTTDNQVNLSTLFPITATNNAICYGVVDISNPGQQVNIGLAAGGSRFNMAPSGFMLIRVTGSKPTLYIDNPSATVTAVLKVFCLTS